MTQSVFVQPQSWRCPACGMKGKYRGYCCSSFPGGHEYYNHRLPVFSEETTDEQLRWSLPGGCTPHYIEIDRNERTVRDAGPTKKAGPRDAFGFWCDTSILPGPAGRVVAFLE